MPWKPDSPCTEPGCPRLIQGGGLCAEHRSQRHRRIDERRGSSWARGYRTTWKYVRAAALDEEPWCRFHLAQHAEHVEATDVDHIDGDVKNNVRSNLRPLCHACHSARTMRDQVARRPA